MMSLSQSADALRASALEAARAEAASRVITVDIDFESDGLTHLEYVGKIVTLAAEAAVSATFEQAWEHGFQTGWTYGEFAAHHQILADRPRRRSRWWHAWTGR